ncbi:hypothetical protein D3C83_106200 [compost metagenome]
MLDVIVAREDGRRREHADRVFAGARSDEVDEGLTTLAVELAVAGAHGPSLLPRLGARFNTWVTSSTL